MSEHSQEIINGLRFLSVGAFGTLYAIGGGGPKWVRRYVGSGVFLAIITIISILTKEWSWWFLVPYAMFIWAVRNGYGADTFEDKVERRSFCGAVLG